MSKYRAIVAAVGAVAVTAAAVDVAEAACTRLAFSVNDYGKEGPIRDAKNLLDKYIAKWAADRKIKVSSVGPKEVTCELFLDVILFDEYTCKAAATVCWNGPLPPGHQVEASASGDGPVVNKAKARAAAPKAAAPKTDAATAGTTPIATGSVRPAPVAAPKQAVPAAAPAAAAPVAPAAARVAPAAPAPAAAPAAPAAPAPQSN